MKANRYAMALVAGGLLISICVSSSKGCTIFMLTDGNQALFCNNEDWKNPKTKIWFVPGGKQFWSGKKRYGCAYVGFDNGTGQGGLNTEGLAYDWVAGFKEKWERDPKMKTVKGTSTERMLESCATVEEAIAFFQTHWEPAFSYAKVLVGDRSGASVIIGARDGKLDVREAKQSRGFGYRGQLVEKMLMEDPVAALGNAARILRAARQEGHYATKYSNVFDLKSGDIFLFRFPEQEAGVKVNLVEELKRGRHTYDIPKLDEQLAAQAK
jgi:hypothetical protein